MLKIYGDIQSGNCFKVKLLLHHLELAHEWRHVDILNGGTGSDEFVRMNPNGKIPVAVLDNGEVLSESNAILNYLAEGTPYLPSEALGRTRVLEWQFFEQYSHEPYIAVARFISKYLGMPPERREEFESKKAGGYKALGVMERRLSESSYLVGEAMTIADISLYGYTHVAEEGGFELTDYPAVQQWLERIERHPRHIAMADTAD